MSVRKTMISKAVYRVAGFLYIDDIDLVVLNSSSKSADAIVARVQLLVDQ